MIKFVLIISILLILLGLACDKDKNPVKSVPIPVEIDNFAIENSENIYFLIWPQSLPLARIVPVSAEEGLILSIWDLGIDIENAYFPTTSSPCMAAGAVEVAIVEIEEPNIRMIELGFIEDPEEWWIINCGITKLWHYSFN